MQGAVRLSSRTSLICGPSMVCMMSAGEGGREEEEEEEEEEEGGAGRGQLYRQECRKPLARERERERERERAKCALSRVE